MPADKRPIPLDTAEQLAAVRERANGLGHLLGSYAVSSARASTLFRHWTAAPA